MRYWAMHNKKKILLVAVLSAVTVVFLSTVAIRGLSSGAGAL